MIDGHLPLDANGVLALPKQPERSIVTQFLDHRGVQHDLIRDYLSTKFFSFLKYIEAGDRAQILANSEARFGNKIVQNLDKISKNDFKLVERESPSESSDYIVDQMLIQGISVDRSLNDSNYDYHLDL